MKIMSDFSRSLKRMMRATSAIKMTFRQPVECEEACEIGGKQQDHGCCSGFTLLEVLVAVTIIAIVLVSALRLQGQSVTMNETTVFYATAPFLAQKKMAEVRFSPQRFSGSESGSFDHHTARSLDWHVNIEEVEMDNPENATLSLLFATVTIYSATLKISYVLNDCFHTVTGELLY